MKEVFKNIHGNVIETPDWLFSELNKEFGFTFDLACNVQNMKTNNGYPVENFNSLEMDWHKNKGWQWLNPPYSPLKPWIEKTQKENKLGAKVVVLMPNVFATKYFASHKPSEIRVIVGRINFIKNGIEMKGNMTDVSIVVYGESNNTKISWVYRDELRSSTKGF